jgi:hypothetical protein
MRWISAADRDICSTEWQLINVQEVKLGRVPPINDAVIQRAGDPTDMNSECVEWLELLAEPERRRCWLLWKALECSPLDRAIDLARAADEFLTCAHSDGRIGDASIHPKPTAALPQPINEEVIHSSSEAPLSPVEPAAQKRTGLGLSPEKREQLLQRLAQGARNAELASEFGLSKQQVQGVRMGSARQISKRRHVADKQEQGSQPTPDSSTSVDEIVRYLRQQDDVVVPQDDGQFLINARFRLPLDKLVSRANRIRTRQGKPEFRLAGHRPPAEPNPNPANGHR